MAWKLVMQRFYYSIKLTLLLCTKNRHFSFVLDYSSFSLIIDKLWFRQCSPDMKQSNAENFQHYVRLVSALYITWTLYRFKSEYLESFRAKISLTFPFIKELPSYYLTTLTEKNLILTLYVIANSYIQRFRHVRYKIPKLLSNQALIQISIINSDISRSSSTT